MRLLRVAIVFSIATWVTVSAKIYQRCELVRELRNFDIPEPEIPTWVCIAQHESLLDTAAMNPGSGDHGLFQISQIYWCSPPGYGCNAPCDKFRDDDIADDLQCIRRIYNEHKRISGNGFNAWVVYSLYCKGDTSVYLAGCAGEDAKPTTPPGNSTENEISPEEEEDGDGYEFPPLPSYPKSAKHLSPLPFNKKSIHDYVLASHDGTVSEKTENISVRQPFSKKSIHHFIPVDAKLQELKSGSAKESANDFKLICETSKEPTNFEVDSLKRITEKTVSHLNKPVTKITFNTTLKETPVKMETRTTNFSNRPLFTKQSIYDFKFVSSPMEKFEDFRKNERNEITNNQTSQDTRHRLPNKDVLKDETDVHSEIFDKNKKNISFEMTREPYQMNRSTTIRLTTKLKLQSYRNTTPKNIVTTRSYITKKPTTERIFDTTDLQVQSSTILPVFLKTSLHTDAEKLKTTTTSSTKELNASSDWSKKFGYKVLSSTTTESQTSAMLFGLFKNIEEHKDLTRLSPKTSTTVRPERDPKQVTFAPGTFFNIQTLPPILPARPLRPPTPRPTNQSPPRPNNRPGGPPRPMRPGAPSIMQASNETIPERPFRPGFGPNRRPAYNTATYNSEDADVASESEAVNENLPMKPFRPGFGPNRRPIYNNANFNPGETTNASGSETVHETLPVATLMRPGFGHNRRPILSNVNYSSDEAAIPARQKPGHQRHHSGRKPNRSRSMGENGNEEDDQDKNSKPPESKVVMLNGNYMYYRTKYGFRLNRNI